jgi:Tol biopolymer transport system component
MQLRPRRRPVFLLAVAGLTAGLLLAAALSAPRVISFAPADSASGVSGTALLHIDFNQPMDHPSVEANLVIEPRPAGRINWEGSRLVFVPEEPWPAGGIVQVRLRAGARSIRGLPLLTEASSSFQVGLPRILYLWPAGGPAELYARTLDSAEPTALTDTGGVVDYSLTSDGSAVAYSTETPAGSELRRQDLSTGEDRLVYTCPPPATCRSATFSADGGWLAFEVHEELTGGEIPGSDSARVFLLPLNGQAEPFALAPANHPTSRPVWSSTGRLAYYDHVLQAYAFVFRPTAPEPPVDLYVPNALGDRGAWSPDGETFVVPEITFVIQEPNPELEEGPPLFYSHLYRIDVASGAVLDVSGEEGFLVEDTGPAFSPDGLWLAFSRKYLDRNRWTLGRQIWRMRADGLAAEALTNEPGLNHSALAWSPDGEVLVYMRFDQTDMTRPAEVWWTALDGSAQGQLAVGAYAPGWIP